jgi:tetratricopeptide (TPR) repeat protein
MLYLFSINTQASNKNAIYNAYITNNMSQWKSIIDQMQRQKDKSNEFVFELLNYQYGYIGWLIGNNKLDEAKRYIALGESNIEILEKRNFHLSSVNAYKSAFYGFRIGLNKLNAPFLGLKSIKHSNLALKLDTSNPHVYIQLGNSEYYMPSVFGGSKEKALKYYKTAQILMERNAEKIKNDWNYLSLLTMIGLTLQETDQLDAARLYFDKILQIEPHFKWVKDELHPKLLKDLT